MSKDICRQLRDLYDLYEDHAIKEDRIGRKDGAVYLRSNPEGKEMRKVVEPILFECADEYFSFYGHDNWKEVTAPVTYKIQKTEAGGGFTALHFEQGMGKVSNRYAAWMFYLNSPGSGHTSFPLQDRLLVEPHEGSLAIWPAAYTHPHHAVNNLMATKYILTGWFAYKND